MFWNKKETHHGHLEYIAITDSIYIGTNACCQTHFEEELLKKGISADISLEEEHVDMPRGVQYYLWLPVKDHTAPTLGQLSMGVVAIQQSLKLGIKLYAHCKNGHGRAPTLVAAYFITKGIPVEEAIEMIKTKRPSIHLEPSQKEILFAFKDYWKNQSI